MVFSSIPFLYYFLPVSLLLYLAAPRKGKNTVLLLSSLVFYAYGEPRYILLMAASIGIGYVLGILIERYRGSRRGKAFTALSVAVSLGFLLFFKYADFLISSFSAATGIPLPLLHLTLPIGISFYTFQMLSYTIDVSRGQVKAQRNFIHLATYIAMFPQLIAGPIVRYSDIADQLAGRSHTLPQIADGIRRFVIGLGKKVLLANTLGELCDSFYATQDSSVLYVWLYAVAFTLHIYFDFSGYSDMAIGLGGLMGFQFPENFRYPFISKSITEFWRRWHMTLGTWFRDYLYIPLGGNRVGKGRWIFNILVVWMATGLWHGAAWNFVVWGLYFAVFLLMERFWLRPYLERSKVWSHGYLMLFVILSFVIFDASNLSLAGQRMGAMVGFGGLPAASAEALYQLRQYGLVLLLAAIGATPLPCRAAAWCRQKAGRVINCLEPLVLAAIWLVATAYLVNGSFNPFLYFRF